MQKIPLFAGKRKNKVPFPYLYLENGKLDRRASLVNSGYMKLFKQKRYQWLLLSLPAYCIAYYNFPELYSFSGRAVCPDDSLRTIHCFLQNGYQFILLPFNIIASFIQDLFQPHTIFTGLWFFSILWFSIPLLFFLLILTILYLLLVIFALYIVK